LEVPWLEIFNNPKLFFGPEGINVLETIQALDAGGNSVTDDPEPVYSAPNDTVAPGNTTKPPGTK
jgi:hypothetical protein